MLLTIGLAARRCPSQSPTDLAPPRAESLAFHGVYIEASTSSVLWARAETYKMSFDGGQVTYYPRFAAKADRHWPLTFSLASVTCGSDILPCGNAHVVRSGDRQVRLLRGPVTEIWDLAPEHAEQSFELAHWPGPGDLRLEVACQTDLTAQRQVDGTLAFVAPSGPRVVCSDAVARDARGRTLQLELGWENGRAILSVPSTFLAEATWPVIVDPLVRTVGVVSSPTQLARPRAAYDPTFDVWLVVCEDEVTTTDTDVLVFRLALDGTLLDSSAVDLSIANAISPDVGANAENGVFLVAWLDQSNDLVKWQHRNAGGTSYGLLGTRASSGLTNNALLSVGGSRAGDLSLVCFTASLTAFRAAVAFTVDVFNNSGPTAGLTGNFSAINDLEASDRAAAGQDWGVVVGSSSGGQFLGVVVGATNALPVASTPLALGQGGQSPRIAGDGPFVATWFDGSSPPAVFGAQISERRGHTFVIDLIDNLSVLENPPVVRNRSDLALAADGCRFVYSFREDHQTTPTATVLNTVRVVPPSGPQPSRFVLDERRTGVGRVGPIPSLCAAGSTGGPASTYLLLEVNTGPNSILSATRYDGRQPGDMFTTVTTRCGAPFAPLVGAQGYSVLGGSFAVELARTVGSPLLLVGLREPTPLPLCGPNPACQLGVRLPALLTVLGLRVDVNVPCDANLLGGEVAFQGVDVLGPGGCPASVFGVDFRLSDTVVATVR